MHNIGMRFENWATNYNNYQKNMRNEPVEKFQFTDRDMSTVPQEKKDEYYKSQVLNISNSRIGNYDANHNGKMEFEEYAIEQKHIYEKMFGEKLDFTIKGMYEMLKQNFNNADTNNDGSIDEQEMSAVFAYMDKALDGTLDGTIDYNTAVCTNWSKPEFKEILTNLKNLIFGDEDLSQ